MRIGNQLWLNGEFMRGLKDSFAVFDGFGELALLRVKQTKVAVTVDGGSTVS
jgi:hypothetical protein